MQRIETGPLQFDDDWPGVFFRGDHAMHAWMTINQALAELRAMKDQPRHMWLTVSALQGLADTFASCNMAHNSFNKENVQHIVREQEEIILP